MKIRLKLHDRMIVLYRTAYFVGGTNRDSYLPRLPQHLEYVGVGGIFFLL
jgi:hypothetical protein